jgi:hypothetical protein
LVSALGKLTANWQSVVEDAALTTGEKEEKRKGQKQLKQTRPAPEPVSNPNWAALSA